ncbi:GTPase IMAP family member 4-like [Danio aesculapii]|uniref:GTPase IMAP family member 4-like n=1 Tax=Danio aesculapii TaxID=1142201 RepID=UPI0024BF26BD|nr:GTPase IMAP family member 4-like [Danio aesculapii]
MEITSRKAAEYKDMSELRIVLVGESRAGKSSSGNTIPGEKVFNEELSDESVTNTCQKHQQEVSDQIISIIDTPELRYTQINEEEVKKEMEKCIEMSAPALAEQCKDGHHVFNNTDEENRSQVSVLLENEEECCSNELLMEDQKSMHFSSMTGAQKAVFVGAGLLGGAIGGAGAAVGAVAHTVVALAAVPVAFIAAGVAIMVDGAALALIDLLKAYMKRRNKDTST